MRSRSALMLSAAASVISAPASAANYFERIATWPVFLNLPAGTDPASETVAEIVAADADGLRLIYSDSAGQRVGIVDISDPRTPLPQSVIDVNGEPTSVAVAGNMALVAVNNSQSFAEPDGHLTIVDLGEDRIVAQCDLSGQPDSVAVSKSGKFAAIAIENERDEGLNGGEIPQLPAGYLAIFDLDENGVPTNCLSARNVELTGLANVAGDDPEPEYVDINSSDQAVVTLQENNHIALVDLQAGSVTGHFPAGTTDILGIDVEENGIVETNGLLKGVAREPDAVTWLDDKRILVANEGDYQGGSRGFSIFNSAGELTYDSANLMEYLAILYGQYPEHLAGSKGVEPEGAEYGRFGDDGLIFVSSERANFVAVFKDNGPNSDPSYHQFLPTAVGPEGILAIPERDLLVVASEVDDEDNGLRSALNIYQRSANTPPFPQLTARFDRETGQPVAWGAFSGMAGDLVGADRIFAVSDNAFASSKIYQIELGSGSPKVVSSIEVTRDGKPAGFDLEGIAIAADGGFWLASEGNHKNSNPLQQKSQIIKTDALGHVEQEIFLPRELYENARRFGFEGIASFIDGETEKLAVAFQRPWDDDPAEFTKIGFFDTGEQSWTFAHYGLEKVKSGRGGWIGLSEIISLGDGQFALIERDNQPGSYASIKLVTVTSLDDVKPVPFGEELPVMPKSIAIDLIPIMAANHGWLADKPEGLAVTADGRIFMVTDNDAADDAHGETQFLEIGHISDMK